MEEFFKKKKHHHVKEIPLAPILDLLVVVIFFLILSSSFVELTKQTIPPAGVSTITDPVAPPPLAPKFFAVHGNNGYRLFIRWSGSNAGQSEKIVLAQKEEMILAKELQTVTADLLDKFKKDYPEEKSIQLGLGPNITYQEMVSVMDGLREHIPDIVLISYKEAVAISNGTTQ